MVRRKSGRQQAVHASEQASAVERCPRGDSVRSQRAAGAIGGAIRLLRIIDLITIRGRQAEDCLVLNVWTPAVKDSGKRPVLVSFHGGGFALGSGAMNLYDGRPLAKLGDVVVVTLNHRLGCLGYLSMVDVGAPQEFAQAGEAGLRPRAQVGA